MPMLPTTTASPLAALSTGCVLLMANNNNNNDVALTLLLQAAAILLFVPLALPMELLLDFLTCVVLLKQLVVLFMLL